MGWVGSWVHKFTWQWVGLGWICMSVGWVGSWVMKMDPWTTLESRLLRFTYEQVVRFSDVIPTYAIPTTLFSKY